MWQLGNIDRQRLELRLLLLIKATLFYGVWQAACGPSSLFQDLQAQDQSKRREVTRTDNKGRKFVNKIPYDVFFDRPLEIIEANKNVAVPKSTPVEKVTESAVIPITKPPSTTPSAENGVISWRDLLPMEELQNEIKTIRGDLAKFNSNQGQFNQNFKLISIEGAELAALAVVVQEHEDSISWKDKAHYVREFGTQMSAAATGLGKENFEKTKSAFQRLSSALDGSIPADSGNVPESRSIQESVSRKGLMKRIEKARDRLKQDVNSAAKFKSMSDQVRHEAGILSALATVITREGYEYTENEDYQTHAKSLIEGAKQVFTATQDEAFEQFKQAVDKISKSCTDCHAAYGNG